MCNPDMYFVYSFKSCTVLIARNHEGILVLIPVLQNRRLFLKRNYTPALIELTVGTQALQGVCQAPG